MGCRSRDISWSGCRCAGRAGARPVFRRRAPIGGRAARAPEARRTGRCRRRRACCGFAAGAISRTRQQPADSRAAPIAQPEGGLPREGQARAPAGGAQPDDHRRPPRPPASGATGAMSTAASNAGARRCRISPTTWSASPTRLTGRSPREGGGAFAALRAPELGLESAFGPLSAGSLIEPTEEGVYEAQSISEEGRGGPGSRQRRGAGDRADSGIADDHLRMPTSWAKSLDTLFGGAEYVAKRVGELTDGQIHHPRFRRRRNRPGPAGAGRGPGRYGGDWPYRELLLLWQGSGVRPGTSVSFGPNARQNHAWWLFGGGSEVMAAAV